MPKTLSISAKCSDMCSVLILEDGKVVRRHEGYVPYGINIGSGDYIELDIDLLTGQIKNWVPITEEMLEPIGFSRTE